MRCASPTASRRGCTPEPTDPQQPARPRAAHAFRCGRGSPLAAGCDAGRWDAGPTGGTSDDDGAKHPVSRRLPAPDRRRARPGGRALARRPAPLSRPRSSGRGRPSPARGGGASARRLLRRPPPLVQPAPRAARHGLPARGLGGAAGHPLRPGSQLRRDRRSRRLPDGVAIGGNPLSILIPCHRVIAASGRLTGFAGGLEAKSRLLMRAGPAGRRHCRPGVLASPRRALCRPISSSRVKQGTRSSAG